MRHFDEQSAEDLEFPIIREMLAEYCVGPTARERMEHLAPFRQMKMAKTSLLSSQELLFIREEESGFPRIEFEELTHEIKQLGIKRSVLRLESLINVLDASRLCNDLITFFKGRKEQYPTLTALIKSTSYSMAIIKPIEKVLDKRLKVRDDASPDLLRIRQSISSKKRQISTNFNKVLKRFQAKGYLADSSETFHSDRRVLSVISTHKRTVKGNIVGGSKSGHLSYIEPQENIVLNNELDFLLDDERREIERIFRALTDELRVEKELIRTYQYVLTEMDVINAKTRLAMKIDARMPAISDDLEIDLIDAYHPLLLLANKKEKKKTFPQSLLMDKFSRMLVISGPNAGGKSITMKTVGLLQVMFQSGLLIPADPNSRLGWFSSILTDIGDNQSIENQLSTYSYRLKRMKHFLDVTDKRTLLLLDEFGTGSDPDLGGALAEVFFETLYNRKAYGVITTHYANIKLKAAKLKNAVNASMLFDKESLEPLFKLSVGQPGSSFTFEVAQINGIPQKLIDQAIEGLDEKKVEMDALIASLQREKTELERSNSDTRMAERKAKKAQEEFEDKLAHYQQRMEKQQKRIERNNKYLSNGQKMHQFIEAYKVKGGNKQLFDEIKKFLAIEKSKLEDNKKKTALKEKTKARSEARKKRAAKKKKQRETPIVVGSRVRLRQSSKQGEVIELKGKNATVMFGEFKTRVEVQKLVAIS